METNARDFSRHFARYRSAAARGEKIRISAPDGVFILMRETTGLTGAELLEPGKGIFSRGGGERIEAARLRKTIARSPWDA